jgi:phosphoribosylformimino-5-aminoimidazole carboxamide ribotide isomerase
MPFRVIPVIDLKAGRAVHAIAGRRDHYQPLVSVLHPNCEVVPLARALRDTLGCGSLYLADLDAIAGLTVDVAMHLQLLSLGLELWIDAGLRNATASSLAIDDSKYVHVAGLETVAGPAELASIIRIAGPDRVILSLDLFDGKPRLARADQWKDPESAADLAREAIDLGIQRLILLDIARVGTGQGAGTTRLTTAILRSHSDIELFVGGGISGLTEIREWRDRGVSGVLIGSALHDGRITAADLTGLTQSDTR